MPSVEETIDRALTAAGLTDQGSALRRVIDSALARAGLRRVATTPPLVAPMPLLQDVDGTRTPFVDTPPADETAAGAFTAHLHAGGQGSLAYKLYVPSSHRGQALPLIVMLHGCRQNPDDFAAGTRMNELAELHGFLVAYPAQDARANGGNCWNWFVTAEQQRGGREASLIAGIVGDIAARISTDRSQVFAAGLSAGGAMALVLGAQYPEIFAGVAVHSGLPLGAAHDVPSAFAAMRGQGGRAALKLQRGLRTLVLHGDADATVAQKNGDAVAAQVIESFERAGDPLQAATPVVQNLNGRRAVRGDHVDAEGRVMVRSWHVHGGGHTWFGGSPAGSYTDASGPDASAELVAFFLGAAPARHRVNGP
jgi:poly(hydroxyalkanoate) depolymerase family esterase